MGTGVSVTSSEPQCLRGSQVLVTCGAKAALPQRPGQTWKPAFGFWRPKVSERIQLWVWNSISFWEVSLCGTEKHSLPAYKTSSRGLFLTDGSPSILWKPSCQPLRQAMPRCHYFWLPCNLGVNLRAIFVLSLSFVYCSVAQWFSISSHQKISERLQLSLKELKSSLCLRLSLEMRKEPLLLERIC